MSGVPPERLSRAFVELADTLTGEFDSADLMHRLTEHCVELLDVDAAGLLLADPAEAHPVLRLVASSTERARVLDLLQLQDEEGPSLECYRTGEIVSTSGSDEIHRRWPHFAEAAGDLGFAEVHAVPMRLRERTFGSLNLFRAEPGLTTAEAHLARALADVTTIGLVQERTLRQREALNEQLRGALDSRVAIEQAKGVLAERLDLDVEEAFAALRRYARSRSLRLNDVARSVVSGSLRLDDLRAGASH
ncbi:ANTAR domain-containing protein [Saccharopolyspora griseoalba]|uniref:ANTAR domain-containing protein n=1 Tax=Saccharopolyspora griseoalba TaxID=1431848 RepID=A0ABW2LI82_9PSEU